MQREYFCYPLEPHARLEQNAQNPRWLGQQMSERCIAHLVVALMFERF
ncbi:MAG: hypothetical protein ACK41E_03430 [Deinococcales bacterium]